MTAPARDPFALDPSARPEEDRRHLRLLLDLCRRYRFALLGAFALGVACALVVALRREPVYRTLARVIVERVSRGEEAGDPRSVQTEHAVLRSQSLIEETLRSPGLRAVPGLPVEFPDAPTLQSAIQVIEEPGTLVCGLAITTRDRHLGALVLEHFIDAYRRRLQKEDARRIQDRSAWLFDRLKEARQSLQRAEEAAERFRAGKGLVGNADQEDGLWERLTALKTDATAAKDRRLDLEARIAQLETARDLEARLALPDLVASPSVAEVRKQEREDRWRLADLDEEVGPRHPDRVAIQRRLERTESVLRDEVRKALSRLRADLELARKREAALFHSHDELRREIEGLGRNRVEWTLLDREARTARDLYDVMLRRTKETGLETTVSTFSLRVIDPPSAPAEQAGADPLLVGSQALAGGLGPLLLLLFLLWRLDAVVRDEADAKRATGLPILATLPHVDGRASTDNNINPIASVAVLDLAHSARSALLLSAPGRPPRTILVTSAAPGEGKTFVAAALAGAIAELPNRRVLLVDADLRAGRLRELLAPRAPAQTGLSNLLASADDPDGYLVPVHGQLFLLPAGHVPPAPSALVASDRMRELLATLAERFDHVIVDSSPALLFADAGALSASVDQLVLVARAGRSNTAALASAADALRSCNAPIVGVVLNDSSRVWNGHYARYGYGRPSSPTRAEAEAVRRAS